MIRLLRDLAESWADQRYVKTNDALRRKLITAEASVERLKQERVRLQNALRSYGQLCQANQQMRQQAERERDIAVAQRNVAWDALEALGTGAPATTQEGALDAAWPDVAAVAGPVPVLLPGQRADLGDIDQEKRYHDGQGDQ